ncbi:MAG TPA: SprT family zinc-dependent metalloprotease [Chloroflexota bacterium]|nr:SprT family zinc-dependent metalloprotease [Chloroflexota bacterium]
MTERDQIQFGDTVIAYSVVRGRRRRKTVEITLDPKDGVIVAAPLETTAERIRDVVNRRAGWIVRQASSQVLQPRPRQFVSGESLPYLGRQARLFVEHAPVARVGVTFDHWSFHVVAPATLTDEERRAATEKALVRWYRARAAERLPERARYWAQRAGYAPTAVLIRDQRQRWASCSPDGTVRFNWRIVMAPPSLIDYVIVHELAHLRVRTHSVAFWAEVARLVPDYRIRRARLKEVGPTLAM